MNLSSLLSAPAAGLWVAFGLLACASPQESPYGEASTGSAATSGGGAAATSAAGTTATTSPTTTATTGATTTTDATTTTTGVAAATTAGGATATTTSDATSTTGSEVVFDCSNRPVVAVPLLTDFEGYDGASDLLTWGFAINDDGSGDTTNVRYMGLYDGSDMSGTPTLLMVAGNGSNYSVQGANTLASTWGGGVGFWINCVNATSYSGITMALMGTTPTGNVTIALTEEDASGTEVSYSTEIAITDTWTVQQFPFSGLTNEDSGTTATGDNIVGLNIGAVMTWVQSADDPEVWEPEAAGYSVQVDDLAFY